MAVAVESDSDKSVLVLAPTDELLTADVILELGRGLLESKCEQCLPRERGLNGVSFQ